MAVMDDLTWRLRKEEPVSGNKRFCRGTLLSRKQYLVDVQEWGFHDARLEERVHMDSQDLAQWTKAIPKEEKAFDELAWRSRWRRAQFSRNGRNHW